ncbi:reverse transcriptase domain-containing protein [Tanacetum coccineum]
MANVTSLLTSLCHNFKDSASTSNSGTLPSQTVTNPRQQINAITTRSGKTLEGPSAPLVPTPVVSIPSKEPEQNPETSTEKVQYKFGIIYTPQVPPPEEEDSIFIEIPKPKAKKTVNVEIQDLNSPRTYNFDHLNLTIPREDGKDWDLKDLRRNAKKFNKWLGSVCKEQEKLRGCSPITTVNAECSAIIMNKVPEKLEDPGKFLIPCALQELDRTSALADSGASINLLPHSIYKQLGLGALKPTRMTLELANCSITHPIAALILSLKRTDKDVEIKSSSSFTLTSPEESEFEAYLEIDSIPPEIDLTLPPTLEVSSSNPTFPTLTGEKDHSWKMSIHEKDCKVWWDCQLGNYTWGGGDSGGGGDVLPNGL